VVRRIKDVKLKGKVRGLGKVEGGKTTNNAATPGDTEREETDLACKAHVRLAIDLRAPSGIGHEEGGLLLLAKNEAQGRR